MVMADRAKDLFHSVGLDLVARPFGISGATSAPEIAGCAKEIFGTDVDLITWDFAMTDGRWHWRESRPCVLSLKSCLLAISLLTVSQQWTSLWLSIFWQAWNSLLIAS